MNDLLKEAIADAKAVRETAMANAKAALEEAFTPRLQSILHAKLSEELEDEMEEDMSFTGDALPSKGPALEKEEYDTKYSGMAEEDDMDLDEILRELEALDSSDVGSSDNRKPSSSASTSSEDGKGIDLYEEDDEEIDMNEVIEALSEMEGEEDMEDEEVNLDELVSELTEADDEEMPAEEAPKEDELTEAYNVIRYLKSQLNEVNLLNAKLLFSNKLFKNFELNERQKMRVIENFDRAHTMREVKLVYSTLAESFGKPKTKARLKESYASKPTRSTKPEAGIIAESNDLAARWKKLAGLTK
jgi:hypothetical protein